MNMYQFSLYLKSCILWMAFCAFNVAHAFSLIFVEKPFSTATHYKLYDDAGLILYAPLETPPANAQYRLPLQINEGSTVRFEMGHTYAGEWSINYTKTFNQKGCEILVYTNFVKVGPNC